MRGQTPVGELVARGFERVAKWTPHKETIKLDSLKWKDTSGWIYSFVTDGRVRYIGISTMVLRSRMDNYAHLVNDRVRSLIKASLAEGAQVELFGLRRNAVLKGDLEKEESTLIKELTPDWNVRS